MSDNVMQRIQRVSRWGRLLILFVAVIHIGSFFLTIWAADVHGSSHSVRVDQGGGSYGAEVSARKDSDRLADLLEADDLNSMAILGSVDVAFFAILYLLLYRLFGLYRQGRIFEPANARLFKLSGFSLLLWAFVDFIYPPLVILVVRFGGWSDTIPMIIRVESDQLVLLLLGMAVYVVGWVMEQGDALKQEQALVI